MGDLSAEPSMEDILSSIKRIIAEDVDPPAGRARRSSVKAGPPPSFDQHEVLELSDPMPPAPKANSRRTAEPEASAAPAQTPEPSTATPSGDRGEDQDTAAAIMSDHTAQLTRGALDSLSRMLVRPDPHGDGTLEGLVREMLRPMLREWLDANLPDMVETMVAREIAKITGHPG